MEKEQRRNIWKITILASLIMIPVSYLIYRDISFSLRYFVLSILQGLLISYLLYRYYNHIVAKTPKKERKHLGFNYVINRGIEKAKRRLQVGKENSEYYQMLKKLKVLGR